MLPPLIQRIIARNETNAGIKAAEDNLKRLDRTATGTGRSLAGIATFGRQAFNSLAVGASASLASALTVTAAINGTTAALKQFGLIADKSAAAGIESEFFQGLAVQAGQAGVEIETLAGALATFAKNSGLAEIGKGRMFSTLKALNPELLTSIQLAQTQEQRILLVADAIGKTEGAAERAALATAAWGDAGADLVPIFAQGANALELQVAQAKNLGLVVDRDLIARADELGDKWDLAAQIIDVKVKSALVGLAPIMQQLVGWAADFANVLSDQIAGVKPMNIPSWGPGGPGTQMNQHLGDLLRGMAYPETALPGLPGRLSEGQYGFDFSAFYNDQTAAAVAAMRNPLPVVGGVPAGAASGGGTGSLMTQLPQIASGVDGVSQALLEASRQSQELADTIAGSLSSAASSFFSTVLKGGDAVGALTAQLGNLADQLLNSALNSFFSQLVGGLIPAPKWNIPKSYVPGGFYPGLAGGGPVMGAGTSTSDSIPAMLSNGEYVINARSASRFRSLLDQINGYAMGGPVGMMSPAAESGPEIVFDLRRMAA